jgi:2-polyprenyl-3-methyl-5-hydroxy-6-metoxy-1,4-benzoquinol methylase
MIDRRAFYRQQAAVRVRKAGRYYQQLQRKQYVFWVLPGLRVLEVGCGLGELLAADATALEREIDERVDRLYGLTAEESKIVEEAGK